MNNPSSSCLSDFLDKGTNVSEYIFTQFLIIMVKTNTIADNSSFTTLNKVQHVDSTYCTVSESQV